MNLLVIVISSSSVEACVNNFVKEQLLREINLITSPDDLYSGEVKVEEVGGAAFFIDITLQF